MCVCARGYTRTHSACMPAHRRCSLNVCVDDDACHGKLPEMARVCVCVCVCVCQSNEDDDESEVDEFGAVPSRLHQ